MDATGAVLPGVTVLVTNVDTGAQRSLVSGADGGYRAALLPLGTYTVRAEMQGFKAAERTGVKLSAGQTATSTSPSRWAAWRRWSRSAAKRPIAEPGKIDLGRTISAAEIKDLPLVSRNPYNFAFLQANVTGYENKEFGVPRINANGTQMHTNYQIDGNTNTEKDRAGLRMLPISEVVVKEVKVIDQRLRPRVRPDHGHGLQRGDALGHQQSLGLGRYRYRRAGINERPFFLAPTARNPTTTSTTHGDPGRAAGPGTNGTSTWATSSWTRTCRDATKVIQRARSTTRAGSAFAHRHPGGRRDPDQAEGELRDRQDRPPDLSPAELSARYFFFKNSSPYNIGGGLNTVDRPPTSTTGWTRSPPSSSRPSGATA